MVHVVGDACIQCKYTDCVDVCPVDCFREGENMLVIDPDECIDCAVCIPECPVSAIYAEEDLPRGQEHMIEINAELARSPNFKTLTKRTSFRSTPSWPNNPIGPVSRAANRPCHKQSSGKTKATNCPSCCAKALAL